MTTEPLTLCSGRYTLIDLLGEGGMAAVWRGYDHRLRTWRAVKLLSPEFGRRQKLRARFESEAQTMALLEHANIVRVYDLGVEKDQPYIVMELCEGGSVVDWLDRNGPMPPRMAVEVMEQVCHGIEAAHSKGVIHRDIKPHNVLVGSDGACKVSDFGIARLSDQDQQAQLTRTGSVMGTLGYMAPEQRNNAKAVDARADVYALAATLYTLLTNRTTLELFAAAQDATLLDGVDPALVPVILKGCSYRREDRYGSAAEMVVALREALPELPPLPFGTPPLVTAIHGGASPTPPSAPRRVDNLRTDGKSAPPDRTPVPGEVGAPERTPRVGRAERLATPPPNRQAPTQARTPPGAEGRPEEVAATEPPATARNAPARTAPPPKPAPLPSLAPPWASRGASGSANQAPPPPSPTPEPRKFIPLAEVAKTPPPTEPVLPTGDPPSSSEGQPSLLRDIEVEAFAGASLTVGLDCRPKRNIGGGRNDLYLLTKMLRLRQNMARLANAARDAKVKPQRAYGVFHGGDGGFECTWDEMVEELAPLERHAPDCEGCPARLRPAAYGCVTWLSWPIPLSAESWMMSRLEPGDRIGGSLALKAITAHNFSGKPVASLRARGRFAAKEPIVRSIKRNWLQSVNVSSDQLFHALLFGGHEPNQCLGMLLWLGAVQIDNQRPEELTFEKVDKALGMGTMQEKVARTRLLLGARSDDPAVREMQGLLHALYLSWINGVRMLAEI